MPSLLAIDPGKRYVGFAYFKDGVLLKAWSSRSKYREINKALRHLQDQNPTWGLCDEAAVELMRADGRTPRYNDLIDVQAVGTALAARAAKRVIFYSPAQWKPSIPKSVHQKRILSALEPRELDAWSSKQTKDDVDAVGIGLFHLGRIDKNGTRKSD